MKTNFDDRATDVESVSNLAIVKNLVPFLWPNNNIWYRLRVIFSFSSLILAKVFTVLIPLSLIWLVDSFNFEGDKVGGDLLFAFGTLSLILLKEMHS